MHSDKISAVYFTGGSLGLHFLTERIAKRFSQSKRVIGDRFSELPTDWYLCDQKVWRNSVARATLTLHFSRIICR